MKTKMLLVAALSLALHGCGLNPEWVAKQIKGESDTSVLKSAFGCAPFSYITDSDRPAYLAEVKARRLLTQKQINSVVCGRVQVGMNKNQVIAALGLPDAVNRSGGAYGKREQWVYRGESTGNYFADLQRGAVTRGNMYFEQGILTSWQF